ncbi:Holliday junction resolvase RuvX [Patescibacteria group bacterium]|nr:Holliday junction resolvase RuvX [Patescibacteria group bacterium]
MITAEKKIGLALAEGSLAEPYGVVRFKSEEAIEKVEQVVKVEQVEQVVLGISEGKMGEESKRFGKKLEEKLKIPVIFQDETLTTHDAQKLSIEAGMRRKKRKKLEDAFSATLILQKYLDR